MLKKIFAAWSVNARKSGFALVSVLIVMALAGLIVTPLLNFISTGAKTGQMYENKTDELYAADSGVQNAVWQIKFKHLKSTFPAYSAYDYATNWDYNLTNPVNNKTVAVRIRNAWMPLGIDTPSESEARGIIEGNRLMVTGGSSGSNTYRIKVTYSPHSGEDLQVTRVGIWLPRGFTYVAGSSNLEADEDDVFYSVPAQTSTAGNEAWEWDFNSLDFSDLPGVNPTDPLQETNITFQYTPEQAGAKPDAVAWIVTSGVDEIPYSWDADIQVYRIESTSGGTTVESYISKAEVRQMQSAMAGDYYATGNSLMVDTDYNKTRDSLLASSNAVVGSANIPDDAEIEAAYLYWSAWKAESSAIQVSPLNPDTCGNFNNWTRAGTSCWSQGMSPSRFRAHYTAGYSENSKYLSLTNNLNLSSYTTGLVTISWDQYVSGSPGSGDGLDFSFYDGTSWSDPIEAFRGNIGTTATTVQYTVPVLYLSSQFKVRFYLVGMSGSGYYVNLDNIRVTARTADESIVFRIDGQQVYLDSNGDPQQGGSPLTSSRSQIVQNYSGSSAHGFSYSCYRDVTALVRAFTDKAPDPALNYPGHATYTVGDVNANVDDEWAYAGWSLILIYSSIDTQGHQLYLFDKFVYSNQDTSNGVDVDYDGDGQPGGTITGFIVPQPVAGEVNAAKITCFVGEGDEWYSGDYLAFNAPESYRSHPIDIPDACKLWDGTTSNPPGDAANQPNTASHPNNVWNSKSVGLTAAGVDVDTFYVTWASNMLSPGDTSARIDPYTRIDVWNLVYMIVSFRSVTTTKGALSYSIR
jgi:hypothetical protein